MVQPSPSHCKGLASNQEKQMNLVLSIHPRNRVAEKTRTVALAEGSLPGFECAAWCSRPCCCSQSYTVSPWVLECVKDSPVSAERLTCWLPSLPHVACGNAWLDLNNTHLDVAIPFLPVSHGHLWIDDQPLCFHFTDGKGETLRGWVICPGWCSKSMEENGIRPLRAV